MNTFNVSMDEIYHALDELSFYRYIDYEEIDPGIIQAIAYTGEKRMPEPDTRLPTRDTEDQQD